MDLNDHGSISLTLGEFTENWCLYSHTLPPSTAIFMLGVCKVNEVYKFIDAYRNSYWRANVQPETKINVRIIATFPGMIEAQTALRMAFNEIRPEANIKGYQRTGRTTVMCIEGENKGKVYPSASVAALENGITPGAMSNHLNGRHGFFSIKNMKFQRGFS